MVLAQNEERYDTIMRLLEAVTALSGVPFFRAGDNYLADDMNNVFIRLSERSFFTEEKVKISVDCRPECVKSEYSKKKIEHLRVLIEEVFNKDSLPFKNRYPRGDLGPNPYHAGPPTISSS
jgi:hypothetical protein